MLRSLFDAGLVFGAVALLCWVVYGIGHERGMHLGVTWPDYACRKLNSRGYDMNYMMRDKSHGE